MYFKQVPEVQWTLVMSVPEDVAYAPLRQWALLFLGILFAATGLMAGVSFWVAKRISRPLDELVAQVKRIGEGEAVEEVQASGYYELDDLAVAFNRMAEGLQESFAELSRQGEENAAQLRSFQ